MSSAEAAAVTSDDLLKQWGDLESAHARVREALERALEREHQLSLTEYEVLRRLAESSGPSPPFTTETAKGRRIQELADEVHLSQSALSRLVDRLEQAGYVMRATCHHDRRGIFACITDEGRKAEGAARPTHVEVLAETLGSESSAV
jgi:DNA-binding MarR family transcriptional regulator